MPGVAMDLETGWDFNEEWQIHEATKEIRKKKPKFLLGTPPCGESSNFVHWLLANKVEPHVLREKLARSEWHCEVCCGFYEHQYWSGNWFLHEHPEPNKSWNFKCIRRLRSLPGVYTVRGPMCNHDLTSVDRDGNCLLYTSPSPRD